MTSGAGECGRIGHHADQRRQCRRGDRERRQGGFGEVMNEAERVGEERMFLDVQPKQFRRLVEQDDEADSGLEARQHRRGDEVGDEAEPQQPGQKQQGADKNRERRRRRHELRRVAVRDDLLRVRAGQYAQRGRRTDAEHARGAEQSVNDRGREGGIEADGDGQSRDGRVGHGLRQDDGCGSQAGDHVEAKIGDPRPSVLWTGRTRCHGAAILVHARRLLGHAARPRRIGLEHVRNELERIVGRHVALVPLPFRELHLVARNFLVWNTAQQMADDVEPRLLLVVGIDDIPGRPGRIGLSGTCRPWPANNRPSANRT